MTTQDIINMEELLKDAPSFKIPVPAELIEGTVVAINKNTIIVDIGGIITGIISGREAKDSGDTLKGLSVGDKIFATVVEEENADGMVVLSLRKASQQRTWKKFVDAFESETVIEVVAKEANKGGLLLDVDGIKGFIPVSQLAPLHYPRVNGADAGMILQRLQALVGVTFHAKIINIDQENGKLILSEKSAYEDQRKKTLVDLKAGQKVKGTISGVVKFGIFVAFDGLEGLVHISEIAWGHVKDPSDYGKVNQEVEVLVIGIDGDKISLSMKRLQPDPWVDAIKTYKIGDTVTGKVDRITQFGAFIKLKDDINGLIHLSELGDEINDPGEVLKIGEEVTAKIISLDIDEHRIGLSLNLKAKPEDLAGDHSKKKDKEEKKEEKVEINDDTKVEDLHDLNKKYIKILVDAGIKTAKDIKKTDLDDLIALDGVGKVSAEKIKKAVE
ncbi:S1 RNA-binding domain-containing protein [Patescibacteria group bacterium]|nr:S1 RNA-binding domain-containing protein [Patescibacteria group bacterium]